MKHQCKTCEHLTECSSTSRPGQFPYCSEAEKVIGDFWYTQTKTPDWCPLNRVKHAYAFKAVLVLDEQEIRPYLGDVPFTVSKKVDVNAILQISDKITDIQTFRIFKEKIIGHFNTVEKQSSEVINIEMSLMDFHYLGEVRDENI